MCHTNEIRFSLDVKQNDYVFPSYFDKYIYLIVLEFNFEFESHVRNTNMYRYSYYFNIILTLPNRFINISYNTCTTRCMNHAKKIYSFDIACL